MALSLLWPPPLVWGSPYKPAWITPKDVRLSRIARSMGCIAAILPSALMGGIKPILIGTGGSLGQISTVFGTPPTVSTTEEGPSLHFGSAGAVSGAVALTSQAVAGVGCSVIARLRGTSSSTSISTSCAVGTGSPTGGINPGSWVSVWGTGVASAGCAGATTSTSFQGTNTYLNQYVTVGMSSPANKPVLYENGVNIGTGATSAGNIGTQIPLQIQIGEKSSTGATTAFFGDIAWAFIFAAALTDAQHWFVAQNPWALIEIFHPFLGKKQSGQALTLTAAFGSYIFTGEAATLNKALKLTAANGLYNYTGEAANLNKALNLTAARGFYNFTGEAATLSTQRNLAAGFGSYAYTGEATTMLKALRLSAAFGPYTYTGEPVTLIAPGAVVTLPPSVRWVGPNAGKTDEQ